VSLRTSLTLLTAPAAGPLELVDVKSWVKQDGSDDDALFEILISAAREFMEKYLRRPLLTQSWRLTLDVGRAGYANELPAGVYELPISELCGELPCRRHTGRRACAPLPL
jgi:uncharacterized phiE125 gp8 family phage protein